MGASWSLEPSDLCSACRISRVFGAWSMGGKENTRGSPGQPASLTLGTTERACPPQVWPLVRAEVLVPLGFRKARQGLT